MKQTAAIIAKDGDLSATEIIGQIRKCQVILHTLEAGSYISKHDSKFIVGELQKLKDPHMVKYIEENSV